MTPFNPSELEDRMKLLESLVEQGRESTERWGWVFLLWGIGPLLAILWSSGWRGAEWAWPVTIGICIIVNGLGAWLRKRHGHARTVAMRSIGAVWKCSGVSVLLIGFGVAMAPSFNLRFLYAGLFALTAVAHASSSIILRWKVQFLAALAWWTATVLALVVADSHLQWVAVGALALGNVAFGAWLTFSEWRRQDA